MPSGLPARGAHGRVGGDIGVPSHPQGRRWICSSRSSSCSSAASSAGAGPRRQRFPPGRRSLGQTGGGGSERTPPGTCSSPQNPKQPTGHGLNPPGSSLLSSLFPVSHSTCGEKAGWGHPPSETSMKPVQRKVCYWGMGEPKGVQGIWYLGVSLGWGPTALPMEPPKKWWWCLGCPGEALRSLWEQRQDFICHQLYSNPGFCLRNPRQSLPDPVTGGSAIPSPGCRWRAGTQPGGDGAPEPPRCIQGCSHPCKPPPAPHHQHFTCVQLWLPTPRKRASLLSSRSLPRNGGRGTWSCRSPLALAKFIPSGGGSSFTAGTAWLR